MSNNAVNNKTPGKPKKASTVVTQKPEERQLGAATNGILWLITIALVVGVSLGNQYYASLNPVVRLLAVIVAIVLALVAFLVTNQGRKFLKFAMESMLELKKIYYPTRKETLQTSIIVVLISVLVSFMFWIFDFVIQYFVNLITTWRF
ncbi:preprotein translocase subunit SecE [Psittacicella melopsittaci]|uniref:Protein translocase subunit SecE n=1 Tax=Psittacicella melopsittaci TaxID=2028576 RepID=A0A3A1Y3G7_9GAMM|nr:preprotein translocase subunit SecE [Psittacicella melopsittaci]RIY31991.1 preprotein translocase subunit SecE [Psittacicella melopsittaci]